MKGFEICFFRHGIALDREDPGVTSDSERPLTEEGIRKTRAAAEGLKRMDAGFEKILTSPWLRASQTASILSEVLLLSAPEEMAELEGDRTPEELVGALPSRLARRTLLVGHEPLLSATVIRILGGNWALDFKKSGACALYVDTLPTRKPATLLWHLTSRQLRWIAKG
jgi:phosphohistidine phosphatase